MVQHLWEFSPRHCNVIGKSGVHNVVRFGMERAASYGFTNRGPVRLYLNLTFMFGSEFDTDPLFPWAAAVLKSGSAGDQDDRAELLHRKTLEFLEITAGPNFQYAKSAFRRRAPADMQTWLYLPEIS